MKAYRLLGALLLGIFLAACGGGEEPVVAQATLANPLSDLSQAEKSTTTLDGRVRALAVQTAGLTNDELFNWSEVLLPSTFPKGPVTGVGGVYQGVTYTYRCYLNGNCVGVVTAGGPLGGVFVLIGGVIKQYGFLSDYTCQVKPTACGASTTIAGKISLTVTTHTVTPNLVDGKFTATSVGMLGATEVVSICAESLVVGELCFPYTAGRAVISGVANSDAVQYTLRTRAGTKVWLEQDPSKPAYWACEGLGCRFNGGFIEYAEDGLGYRKPSVTVEAAGLVLRFARNRFSGFGLNNLPTEFVGDSFRFVFIPVNGDAPTTVEWHRSAQSSGEFRVTLSDATLKCADTGNIAVYRAILGVPPGAVIYSTVPAGWLSVGPTQATAGVIWDFGPGVTPVVQPPLYGFSYRRPGC